MWYCFSFAAGMMTATALLAWFLHAVERSQHTEDEEPESTSTRPATIQVRKYPRYRAYTNSANPSTDPDITVNRTSTYRYASQSDLHTAAGSADSNELIGELTGADFNRMGFVLWGRSTRGWYSED